jgi:hypothetical protein
LFLLPGRFTHETISQPILAVVWLAASPFGKLCPDNAKMKQEKFLLKTYHILKKYYPRLAHHPLRLLPQTQQTKQPAPIRSQLPVPLLLDFDQFPNC